MRLHALARRLVFCGLFVLAALVGSPGFSKGPPPDPDFMIDLRHSILYTDATVEPVSIERVQEWVDDVGDVWIRLHFHNTFDETYYFEVVLPKYPKGGEKYVFDLTAGPDGFVFDGILYDGLWAVAGGEGRTKNGWQWVYDGYTDKYYKWPTKEVTWEPMEGYLLQ